MKPYQRYGLTMLFPFLLLILSPGLVSGSDPIRIGVTVSLQGEYQEPSEMMQHAMQLWERETNDKGGLLGRPVKLLIHDDRSDPELSRQLYRKLMEQDKVDLVFSPYGSPLTLAASEITEKHRYVMLAAAASAEAIWERGFRYIFGVYALGNRYFIGQLDLMARKNHKTLALLHDRSSPFNVDVIEGTVKWAERFKLQVVFNEGYRSGTVELPSLVDRIKTLQPNGLILSAYPSDCYQLLELLAKAGFKPKVLGMTIAPIHPDFQKNAGAMADRVFGPSQWEPDERIPFPGTKRFIEAFKAMTGKMPSYHAGSAYASCQLYEQAIKATRSLSNEAIRDHIAALDTVTVIGRFKVDPTGRQVGHNPILIQWQNGKKEIVWPLNMQTAEPQF